MDTIHLRAHIKSDGILDIHVPTTLYEEEVDVVLTVRPTANGTDSSVDTEWPERFFERTAGCLSDDPISRWPQGLYERREEFA